MKIKTKRKAEAVIPSASMSDIAFLLIIFFMVSTVFNVDIGVVYTLPQAASPEMVEDKMNIHITIPNPKDGGDKIEDPLNQVTVEGEVIHINNLENEILRLRGERPEIYYIVLKADESIPFKKINYVMQIIKRTKITKLKLATEYEK